MLSCHDSVSYLPLAQAIDGLNERLFSCVSVVSFGLLEMFKDKSLMTVADAAGVVGEAPNGFVRLNGVLWKLPDGCPASVAKEIVMVPIDTRDVDEIHVPQFRLEAELGMKPKVYSFLKRAGWNRSGWNYPVDAVMEPNQFSLRDSKETLTVDYSTVVSSASEKLAYFKDPPGRVAKRARTV